MNTATAVQETVAIENGQHDLVRGEYTPEDARDILNHLIDKKINFHNARVFSHDIRFGQQDEASKKRIIELKQCRQDVLQTIAQAEENGKMVRIHANILIDIV